MRMCIKTLLVQILFISICLAGNKIPLVFSGAQITLDKQSGTPKDILFKKGKKPTAESFFQAYKSVYNLTAENKFIEFRSHRGKLGQTHRRFKQYYKGLELAEVQYLLHEKDGLVHHAHGRLIHGLRLDVKPALDKAAALQSALNHINAKQYMWENPAYNAMLRNSHPEGRKTYYPEGQLMISAGNKERRAENFRLVYRFEIYTAIPFGGYAVDVDAISGEIIGKLPLVYHEDVQGYGQSLYNGLVPITVTDNNFPKPPFTHLNDWNAYGGSGQSWWFADTTIGNVGGYGNDWYEVLDTDPIELNGESPQLSFYHRYSVQYPEDFDYWIYSFDAYDGLCIKISADSGDTWEVLRNPISSYTCSNIFGFFYWDSDANIPGWAGQLDDWTSVILNLSEYAGQTVIIRFTLVSDGYESTSGVLPDAFGWQIDEITISNSSEILFKNDGTEAGCTAKSIYGTLVEANYRLRDFTRGSEIVTSKAIYKDEDYMYIYEEEITDEDSLFTDDEDNPGVSVHWATESTYDYYLDVFGRNSFDDKGSSIKSFVNCTFSYPNGDISPNNAMWGGFFAMYGKGDGTTFHHFVSLDFVGHELTHGVTQHSAGLIYENEPGAINESFSDIFGVAVEFSKENENGDWLLGEDIRISGYCRSLQNPKSKNDPDTYKGEHWIPIAAEPTWDNDYGGVHTNCGVQNHWFYLLSEGGSGTNDNGDAYSVSGIGIEDAEQIAYRNLSVYLMPTSQFEDARLGSINAVIDLFGINSEQHQAVLDAWYAVGVYFPFVGPYAKECMVDNTYQNPGLDTLEITAQINNPYSQNIIVKAFIESFAQSQVDTITLYDDGMHQDSVASDNYFGGSWPVTENENSFNIHIGTSSLDSGYNNIYWNAVCFTSIGPVQTVNQSFIDVSYSEARRQQNIRLILHNKGGMSTAENVKAIINTQDPRVNLVILSSRDFGDIAAAATDTSSNYYTFWFAEGYNPNSTINNPIHFNVTIYSNDYHYWTSSFEYESTLTGIADSQKHNNPDKFTLLQNYPNPFNPNTVISYQLPVNSEVNLSIYNLLGQKVATLVNKRQPVGTYKVEWDATGFASGVYLYRIVTDNGFADTKKLLLLK